MKVIWICFTFQIVARIVPVVDSGNFCLHAIDCSKVVSGPKANIN